MHSESNLLHDRGRKDVDRPFPLVRQWNADAPPSHHEESRRLLPRWVKFTVADTLGEGNPFRNSEVQVRPARVLGVAHPHSIFQDGNCYAGSVSAKRTSTEVVVGHVGLLWTTAGLHPEQARVVHLRLMSRLSDVVRFGCSDVGCAAPDSG
jgi:hypothetical protein